MKPGLHLQNPAERRLPVVCAWAVMLTIEAWFGRGLSTLCRMSSYSLLMLWLG
jgi:hypothetical protein